MMTQTSPWRYRQLHLRMNLDEIQPQYTSRINQNTLASFLPLANKPSQGGKNKPMIEPKLMQCVQITRTRHFRWHAQNIAH